MGHGESRRSKERTPEAIKVLSDCSNTEGASTSGRGHPRSEHRREKMIWKAKEGTGAAKDAIFSDALALKRIVPESELCVYVISAVPLDIVRFVDPRSKSVILKFKAHCLGFKSV